MDRGALTENAGGYKMAAVNLDSLAMQVCEASNIQLFFPILDWWKAQQNCRVVFSIRQTFRFIYSFREVSVALVVPRSGQFSFASRCE